MDDRVLSALEMVEKSLPRWIPCSERLPEENQAVLVYCYGSDMIIPQYGESIADAIARTMKEFVNVTVGWFSGDGWYSADWLPMMVEPSYWMPLPDLPEGGAGNAV